MDKFEIFFDEKSRLPWIVRHLQTNEIWGRFEDKDKAEEFKNHCEEEIAFQEKEILVKRK